MKNLATIQGIYEAFSRGDAAAIASHMSPDVAWDQNQTATVPWLAPRRGREGVLAFLRSVAEDLEFQSFQPKEFLASADGKVVVVLVDLRATVKKTGRPFREEDEAHVWRFDDAGQVVRFRHGVDSLAHEKALRG